MNNANLGIIALKELTPLTRLARIYAVGSVAQLVRVRA